MVVTRSSEGGSLVAATCALFDTRVFLWRLRYDAGTGASGSRGCSGHASAAPAHDGSMLGSLLSPALEELPSGEISPGMPPLPVLPRAAAPAAVPPAPTHSLTPPGAPRRVRTLPPPPVVPDELFSGLRPLGGSSCASAVASGGLGDGIAGSGAPVPAALQRALALLAGSVPARHRAGGVV